MTLTRRAFIAGVAGLAVVPLTGTAQAHHRPNHGRGGDTTVTVTGPVLTVTQAEQPMAARLTWTAASKTGTTVSGQRIFEGGAQIADVGGVLTFLDEAAVAGTAYYVVVRFADGTTVTSNTATYVTVPSGDLLTEEATTLTTEDGLVLTAE